MLKVIKSNVLFALVLLLSIPAFAAQPAPVAQKAVKTGWMSRLAARVQDLVSVIPYEAYQAMPSIHATSYGKTAMAYLGSAAQTLLDFAKQHSTAIKCTTGALAVCALGWAGYRKVKAILHKRQQFKQICRESMIKQLRKQDGRIN